MPQILKLQALKQGLDDFAHKTAAPAPQQKCKQGVADLPDTPGDALGAFLK